MRLSAISDASRERDVWPLGDRPSMRNVLETFRMRVMGNITLEFQVTAVTGHVQRVCMGRGLVCRQESNLRLRVGAYTICKPSSLTGCMRDDSAAAHTIYCACIASTALDPSRLPGRL